MTQRTLAAVATVLVLGASTSAAGRPSHPQLRQGNDAYPGTVATIDVDGTPLRIVATARAVWVAAGLGGVARIDPRTNQTAARIRTGGAVNDVAAGFGAVWATDVFRSLLLRIDPRTNRIVGRTRVGELPSRVAVGHGLVWVASQLESTVAGIDPRSGQTLKLARFAHGELWPGGLAVGPEGVWVITGAGNVVSLFDPETMRLRYRLPLRGARTLVTVGRSAWVGLAAGRSIVRIRDGRLSHAETGVRSNGYGPTLASAQRLWLASGRTVVALDPTTGAVVERLLLDDGRVSAFAVEGGLWIVDADQRALFRVALLEATPTRPAS